MIEQYYKGNGRQEDMRINKSLREEYDNVILFLLFFQGIRNLLKWKSASWKERKRRAFLQTGVILVYNRNIQQYNNINKKYKIKIVSTCHFISGLGTVPFIFYCI